MVVARDVVLAVWNLKKDDPNNDPICITAKTETTMMKMTFGKVVLVVVVVEGEDLPRL